MRLRRLGARTAWLALAFGVACDQVTVTTPDPASVELSAAELTIAVGETVLVSATVRDGNGNQLGGQPITWSATDPAVASVSSSGSVQGLAVGTTTITATSGAASATVRIIVRSALGFALDRTSVSFTTAINGTAGPETVLVSGTESEPVTGLQVATQYDGAAQGWLDVALSSGSTPSSLVMSVNAQGLAAGSYSATVILSAPDVQSQAVSVSLQVTGGPAIGLSRNSIRFEVQQNGAAPARQDIAVTNAGSGSLGGLSATVQYTAGQPTGWLSASLQSSLAPTVLSISAQQGNLAPGTYDATVRIASSSAANSPVLLPVTLVVSATTGQPRINLSDTVATFVGVQGQPDPPQQVISITNSGGGTLDGLQTAVSYAAGQPTGWLRASLSSTTAPTSLTLIASTGSLAPGTYQASVELVAAGATNSPRFVTVLFTINGPPTISVAPTSATFAASSGGSNPTPQAIDITNGGGGTLTGLATSVSYGSGSGWLATSLSTTTAPATLTLSPTLGSLAQGTYTATVTITSGVAANSPVTLPVTFTVGPPAARIAVSPTSLNFSAVRGGANPAAQTSNVTNTGGLALTGLTASATNYAGGASGWANTSLSATSAPSTLTVSPQTTALAPGTYTASVQVASPVASNSPQSVAVSVAVPGVALASSGVSASVGVGGSTVRTVAITNAGGGSLSGYSGAVNYVSGGTGWLTPSFTGNTLNLNASGAGLSAGTTHTATVLVTANEDVVGASVTVTLTVTAPPAIGLSPASVALTDTGPTSMPASGSISVTNLGAGTLDGLSAAVSYSGGATGWLAASLASTTAPATISLTATPGSLAPGTYNATVTVSSSSGGVGNNPSAVPVTFTVGPRPTIGLSATTASFGSWQGGPDPTGSTVSVSNTGTGTLDGLSTSISYSGGATGWLTATLGGTTAPATINLSAATGALAAGTYTATVTVASTAARVTNSPQTITVTFTVAPPPAISLSPGTLAFTGFAGGTPPANQQVSVTNGGGGTLSGLSVDSIVYTSGTGWLNASLAGSTAPATLTATADPGALAVGSYAATVYVGSTAAGVTNSPQSVAVTFNVQAPPTIVLSANTAAQLVSEAPGSPATASTPINVTDAGTAVTGLGTTINYTTGTGWLTATLSVTTTPSTLTLQSSAGSLAPGTYNATVDVTSGVAGNSPQSVAVTLTVQTAPSISLTAPSPMLFNAIAGGANPASQAVPIANTGGGSLTGLASSITYLTPGGAGVPAACTDAATGWLASTLSATTAPSTATVQATTGALAAGVYCARVKVTSPVARNSEPFTTTSPDFLVRFTVS